MSARFEPCSGCADNPEDLCASCASNRATIVKLARDVEATREHLRRVFTNNLSPSQLETFCLLERLSRG